MHSSFSFVARFGLVAPCALLVSCGSPQRTDRALPSGSETPLSVLNEVPASLLDPTKCDVLVNGGTTAAISAALAAAASVGSPSNLSAPEGPANPRPGTKARVCLLEPTDWTGGQLTASGVSAIDYSWHQFQREMRSFHNNNFYFFNMMKNGVTNNVIEGRNPGGCWVSAYCNTPQHFLTELQKLQNLFPNLQIFRNTVVKSVQVEGKRIVAVQAIQRSPKRGSGWSKPLSAMWDDWYSPLESEDFKKKTLDFDLRNTSGGMLIDASETGDFMVLSNAKYLQGVEIQKNRIDTNKDLCGQAFVFPFAQSRNAGGTESTFPIPSRSSSFYGFGKTTAERIFTYRQIAAGSQPVTLQNWNPGNDFPYEYFFLNKAQTRLQFQDWRGGVNGDAVREAEEHALGWHQFLKNQAPYGASLRLSAPVMGTSNGLSKLPYLRDIRRSVGVGGFFIRDEDILPQSGSVKGKQSADSLGTGLYAADFHSSVKCAAPGYLNQNQTNVAPFTLPFLAHTNESIDNLLVAGKSMAQTYYVNAATRLQPIEWNSGWGAGTAAAHMWRSQASSLDVGLAFVQDPVSLMEPLETQQSFSARLDKSRTLLQKIQYEVVDRQPLWFCNAVGRNASCVTPQGRYRLSQPAP